MVQVRRAAAARWLVVLVSVAGTIVAASAGAAWAQPPQPAVNGPAQPAVVARSEGPGPLISVDFKGGTVSEYIEVLRAAAAPAPVNAITSEAASKVRLAPVRLKDVVLDLAVQAIEAAAGQGGGGWAVSRLPGVSRQALGGIAVYAIDFQPRPQGILLDPSGRVEMGAGSPPMIQVYSLRDLTDPKPGDPPGVSLVQKPETVLTAIKTALEIGAAAEGRALPELKYHQDSGLLIVRGTPEQTGLVQRALNAMESDVRTRRASAVQAGMAGESADDLRAQLAKAKLIEMKQEAELKRASDLLADWRQRVATPNTAPTANTVSAENLAEAESQVQNVAIEVQLARIECERLSKQLRALGEQEMGTGAAARVYVLTAWGSKGADATAALAKVLSTVSATVSKEHAAAAKFDAQTGGCIVTADPWGQELARRVLGEFARANGIVFYDASLPEAGGDGRVGGQGGTEKPK